MNKKIKYTEPCIQVIKLDKEISLQLNSSPPIGPGESFVQHLNSTIHTTLRSPF